MDLFLLEEIYRNKLKNLVLTCHIADSPGYSIDRVVLKKIGLIFFFLAVYFIIKFSFGNLNRLSFFIKIGCNSESKERSFSVETGYEKCSLLAQSKPTFVVASNQNFKESNPETSHPNVIDLKSFDLEDSFESSNEKKNLNSAPIPYGLDTVKIPENYPVEEIENNSEAVVTERDIEESDDSKGLEVPSAPPERIIQGSPRIAESCSCDMPWNPIPWPKRFTIRHMWGDQENKCIPFATNYTTAELLFAPDYRLGHMMPFVDIKGHRFDNNTYAANIGIGGRYIPNPSCDSFCELLGFNGYYDYRQGCIGYFQQVGLGLEILSSRWDFRANAYVPFGKKKQANRAIFDDYIGDYVVIRDDIESISYAFNAEVGCLFVRTLDERFLLYGAAGPYFIARGICQDGVAGGEVRIQPQYKDYVALDLSWRYDRLFETIWQVEIILNLPLYQISGRNRYPCSISDRQIYQPIERFEVMPLARRLNWYTNY